MTSRLDIFWPPPVESSHNYLLYIPHKCVNDVIDWLPPQYVVILNYTVCIREFDKLNLAIVVRVMADAPQKFFLALKMVKNDTNIINYLLLPIKVQSKSMIHSLDTNFFVIKYDVLYSILTLTLCIWNIFLTLTLHLGCLCCAVCLGFYELSVSCHSLDR